MNRNQFLRSLMTVAVMTPLAMFAQSDRVQCTAKTKKGEICKNLALKGGNLCHLHDSTYVKPVDVESVQCSGTTESNTQCKNKTKHASGLCHHHRD